MGDELKEIADRLENAIDGTDNEELQDILDDLREYIANTEG